MWKCIFVLSVLWVILIFPGRTCGQYFGTVSSTFDTSPNGYGWYSGYNRKIQTNFNMSGDEMIYSFYRQESEYHDTGTAGGMTGTWDNGLQWMTDSVYTYSDYQSVGNEPGARYPFACELINGYSFSLFNDYDTSSVETVSQPMFTVCDANFWDIFWADPKRIESSGSAAVIPNAWKGTGDVVYDPDSGYYYWTQAWKEGLNGMLSPVSCVVGKSKTPYDVDSWVWSDYRDMRYDLECYIDSKDSNFDMMSEMHFAYSKDTAGNGNGKGIAVTVTKQSWQGHNNLSYTYTEGWGGDSLSGIWKPNWSKLPYLDTGLYDVDLSELFPWLGETLTLRDSIGFNMNTNTVFSDSADIIIDVPYILKDISVIATEENIVHVLCMVFPASSSYPNCIFPWTDQGYRAGYYDIRGEITDTGVNWTDAVFIANPVDNDKGWRVEDGGMEFRQGEYRTLSLCYAGNGKLLAGWLDKPVSRAQVFNVYDPQEIYNYIDDGYLIFSEDNGSTWTHDMVMKSEKGIEGSPSKELYIAGNVTESYGIVDEGWTLSTHGTYNTERVYSYAVSQYYDAAGMEETYLDHAQFLKVWQTGFIFGGIEEDITIASDFQLYQNYPNPFNPTTEIRFALSEKADVKLSVFNSNGQLVKSLFNGRKDKGIHKINFDAAELNSGIYFYKLEVGNKSESRKMLFIK